MTDPTKATTEFQTFRTAASSTPQGLQPCLVEVSGDSPGRTFCLTSPVYVLGREDQCALHVDAEGVSRRHCEFIKTPEGYDVRDLGSTNGTFVNGSRQETHSLKAGDRLALGPNAVYTYRVYQVDEGSVLSQLSEGVTKDPVTGAVTREHLVERLQSQIALGREQRFDLAIFAISVEASEGTAPTAERAVAVHECLKKLQKAGGIVARIGTLEFVLSQPFNRDSEIQDSWKQMSPELARVGDFGVGLATTRDLSGVGPEGLLREALQKLRLARLDIPNSLVR